MHDNETRLCDLRDTLNVDPEDTTHIGQVLVISAHVQRKHPLQNTIDTARKAVYSSETESARGRTPAHIISIQLTTEVMSFEE